MNRKKNYLYIFLISVALVFFGYYRDFVFKKINALMQAWDHDMDYTMPPSMRFLESYEYATLENIKWLLTVMFTLIYLAISLFAIKVIFNTRTYRNITIGAFIGVTVASGILILLGLIFHSASYKMYEFARYLMGMVQSPIALMVLIPAFIIAEREKPEGLN